MDKLKKGKIAQISCNIDDMTAEDVGYAMELLMEKGALDVYTSAIGMKKSRPGLLFTCICSLEKEEEMAYLMLKHTTTLGVRVEHMDRYVLDRRFFDVKTELGTVRMKESFGLDIRKRKPEFEDMKRIASELGCSIQDIRNALEGVENGGL